MKKGKDNVLYSFTGGKATVYEDGRIKFEEKNDVFDNDDIARQKFSNKKDAVLMLLNAGWYYKRTERKHSKVTKFV